MKALYTFILGLALIVSASSFIPDATSGNGDLAVIIHADNPVSTMTSSQVKLIYLRKINKRWKELNKNIIPVDKKGDSEIRKSFLKDVLQMTSDEMTRYFTEREYQNAEAPPVKLSTEAEMVDYVENNVGAIAVVNKNSIKAGSKVKIVFSL